MDIITNKKNGQSIRLIDANAMYQRFCVDKSGLDGIYDSIDLPDMLAEMPTIDAIPVEWLIQRMLRADDESDMKMRDCICVLADEYQKEQEAQDGK